jgi:hypothetical protein
MTVYPDWIKVSCPTCNAKPYEHCTSCLTLPKGNTLRYPHNGRLLAYEQTQFKGTTNKEIRDS